MRTDAMADRAAEWVHELAIAAGGLSPEAINAARLGYITGVRAERAECEKIAEAQAIAEESKCLDADGRSACEEIVRQIRERNPS